MIKTNLTRLCDSRQFKAGHSSWTALKWFYKFEKESCVTPNL